MVQLHELFLMVFIFVCVKMIFKCMPSWRIISASLILLSTFLFCNAAAWRMAVSSAIYSSTSQAPRTVHLHAWRKMVLGLTFQHLSCLYSEAPALPADTFFSPWNLVVITQSVCPSPLLFLSTANPQLRASLHPALQGCTVAREV